MSIEPANPADPEASRARLFVLAAALLWSLAGVFIKSLDVHPLSIVFYRSLFAALFFAPLAPRKSWTLSLPLLFSALSYTAAISAFVSANKLTTAANAIVLQYTAPIFVFVFARVWFREAVSRLNLVALAAGTLGVAVIFAGSAGQPDFHGVALAVLSGLFFAIYMTSLRFVKEIDPRYLTLANNLVCSAALLPWAGSELALTGRETVSLMVMGVVQLGIPYFLFSRGLEKISLQEASLLVLIEPVLNPIWVALVHGEVPARATLWGGGLILSGLGARYALPALRRRAPAE